MGAILKIYFFASSPELKGLLTWNLVGNHGGHLENLFFASPPEPKGQLTQNLVGSIGVTCRSKKLKSKMAAILNIYFSLSPELKGQLTRTRAGSFGVTVDQKYKKNCSDWKSKMAAMVMAAIWKSIFRFFSWNKRPLDTKLGWKHRGDW